MLIEIRGVSFLNKGAELMLRAALERVGNAFPSAGFVVAPGAGEDYVKRARLGTYQKLWLRRYRVQWGRLGPAIPRKFRRAYGLVLDDEIDVVLDASGFAYGDYWGERHTSAMASYVRRWKRRGAKVVLLPQAMGPFTSPRIRKAAAFIAKNADLVFPRDDVSYEHIVDLVGERENVCQAPDFTNLISGIVPPDREEFAGRFCLIPNYHMVRDGAGGEGGRYISFCVQCVNSLLESASRPFVLVHEGRQDLQLAQSIVRESAQQIEIVTEQDALKAKGILGLCAGVIGSRFHGLISALSQGVPALATGWSHKYQMLFKEYGMPDGCLPIETDPVTLEKQVHRIVDADSRKEIIAMISRAGAAQREQAEGMWRKVVEVIRQ